MRVVSAKKRELGTLIVRLLYYLGFEFNYVTTGASADMGFFSRVGDEKRGGMMGRMSVPKMAGFSSSRIWSW